MLQWPTTVLLVSDFDFELPDELIAQQAAPRGRSRLLVLDRPSGAVRHASFADVGEFLDPGDLLVLNNTRVFAARLLGRRVPSGGAVECLLIGPMIAATAPRSTPQAPPSRPLPPEERPAPTAPLGAVWDALVHPGQKLKPGALVRFEGPAGVLMGEILERRFHGRRTIRLWSESGGEVDRVVDAIGHVPLPPYIRRNDTAADRERYQTVYARVRGSVAAPTAGLHFTTGLLDALGRRGIERTEITLHVGYGTFQPVRVAQVEDHVVAPEQYDIPDSAVRAITAARARGRRVVAVGTTTTRALEDAASRPGGLQAGPGLATIFIRPGCDFRVVSALVTNFHLPASSLLMLVAAFAGRDHALSAYRTAIANRYRFYSYGDAMLVRS